MALQRLTTGAVILASMMVTAPALHAQTPASPVDQSIVTLIQASQIKAVGERCKWLGTLELATLRGIIGEANAGIPGDRLLEAALARNGAVNQVAAMPCAGAEADATKKRVQSDLAYSGMFWAERARAFAIAEQKQFPFLAALKGGGLAAARANITTAVTMLRKEPTLESQNKIARAEGEIDVLVRASCAQLGSKSCGAPPPGVSANLAVTILGLVRDYGNDLSAYMAQIMPAQVVAPAAPAAPRLAIPTNPRDYYRFASLGDIEFGRSCNLGEPTAFLPESQVPASIASGSNITAPIFDFGAKQKNGDVTAMSLGGSDFMVVSVVGDVKPRVAGAAKLARCGY